MFDISMDFAVLILLVSFLIGLLGIIFIFMRFKLKYRGLSDFLFYYLIKVLGVSISAFALFIPEQIRMLSSNVLVYIAILFLYSGVLRLYNLKFNRVYMGIVSFIVLIVFGYFIYINPNPQFRVLFFSSAVALTFFVMIIRVFRSPSSNGLKDFIIPVSTLIVINSVVRTVRAYYSFAVEDVFLLTQDGINVVIGGLLNIMLLSAIYAIVADRVVNELEISNENEKFYSSIYFSSPIPIIIGTLDGSILHYNDAVSKKFRLDEKAYRDLNWNDFCTNENTDRILKEVELLVPGSKTILYGIEVYVNDISFPAEMIIHRSETKENVYKVYILDLSGNSDYIKGLSQLDKAKEGILGAIPGFAYQCIFDEHWTMNLLSDSFYTITGYQPSEVIGNKSLSFNDLILPEYRSEVRTKIERSVEENSEYVCEYKIRIKDGSVIWVWERGKVNSAVEGQPRTLSGFISDITYRKEVEGALEYLSYHDSLTGLYNRRFMEEEMSRLDVKRNLPFTVIQLDIDSLKFANDAFGHKYGDKLITTVSSILKESLRQDEIVGRMGGDEFLILLPDTTQTMGEVVVQRILDKCNKASFKTRVNVSIGTATKTDESESLGDILSIAEERMYSNKMFKSSTLSEELIEVLLEELYTQYPEELDVVKRTANLIVQFTKHLKIPVKKVETILKACRVHRIGLLSEALVTHECMYKTEETYRMIRSIPDFQKEADIIVGYCEHYDGGGHPKGYSKDDVNFESQVLALCSYIALNGLDGVSFDIFRKGIDDKRGTWFSPEIIDSYIDMLSNKEA